jgi:hypothetical protein
MSEVTSVVVQQSSPARLRRAGLDLSFTRNAWGVLALTAAMIWLLGRAGTTRMPVVLPLLAIIAVAAAFVGALTLRNGALPFFEIGALYLAMVALYAAFPLLGNLLSDGIYTELSDARMLSYGVPSAAEIGDLAWLYFAYLVTFAITYMLARGGGRVDGRTIPRPPASILVACLIFLGASEMFNVYIRIAYDLRPTNYAESYLVINQLPLAVRQINALTVAGAYVAKLGILLFLFLDYRKNRKWIALWLLAAIGSAFLEPNAERSGLLLILLAAAILYNYVVKPIRTPAIIAMAVTGFSIYMALGILRNFGAARFVNPFGFTDFDGIFANAFDLLKRKQAGEVHLPLTTLYFGDIFALVPQQFLPFEKFGAAEWYMREFYPKAYAEGGGAAFGAVAEGIVGLGLVDLIWRAALLGVALATAHRRVSSRPTFWWMLFYAWTAVYAYHSFRASTMALANYAAFRFVPATLVILAIAGLLQGVTRRRDTLRP